MKYYLLAILFFFTTATCAEEKFPEGCQSLRVQQETLNITTKEPILVLIHNRSTASLWLTHPVTNASASAGWTSQLDAGKWSALAVEKETFEMTCIESRPGHEQQMPCSGMIMACQFSGMTLPEPLKGTFWAAENMRLSALTEELGNRGFVLPAK